MTGCGGRGAYQTSDLKVFTKRLFGVLCVLRDWVVRWVQNAGAAKRLDSAASAGRDTIRRYTRGFGTSGPVADPTVIGATSWKTGKTSPGNSPNGSAVSQAVPCALSLHADRRAFVTVCAEGHLRPFGTVRGQPPSRAGPRGVTAWSGGRSGRADWYSLDR